MAISINDATVRHVHFTEGAMVVGLNDGRALSVPLDWFPRLKNASPSALAQWQISAAGHGIHWPDLDEDISVEGLLFGAPAVGIAALTQPTHPHKH